MSYLADDPTATTSATTTTRGKVLYRGPLLIKTIRNEVVTKSDNITLDNDENSLIKDATRLDTALKKIAPELTIVDRKRGDEDEEDETVSDLFVLCEAALQYEPAIADYLARNEDQVRYALCHVRHMMPPLPNRSSRPLINTLAIRRQALRKLPRTFGLILMGKALFLILAFYSLVLIYKLVFQR